MLQERNGSPSVKTLKLLKSTLRGSMLQLQISTDCRAHRSPMQWESLVIGPQAAQTPFELWQWRAQMCWYTSLFPLLSLGRLSQCPCCWKVHFPSAMLSSSCHPYLSSWRKMPWRFPMCSRSLFFFFPSKYLSSFKVNPSSSITPRPAPNSPKILFFQAGKSCLIHQTCCWHLEY